MKIMTSAVATFCAALLLSTAVYAEEKKPANKNAAEKLGDTLKKAGDTLNKATGNETEKPGARETVNFKGNITAVDDRARTFRASGSAPGLYSVTDASRLTKGNTSVSLRELEKGDAISGTARRTGEDTFQVLSASAVAKEVPREKSVLERLIPEKKEEAKPEKKTEKKTEKK
jgi:hypothetical protein